VKYFKNTELAKLYNVSEKSVRNWIDAAEAGKLDLRLHDENGKKYIANNSQNTFLVEQLVQKGKKYKNTRGYKVIHPTQKFYDLYTTKQIFDIISSVDIYREIPLQYSYFNSGAERWDQYVKRLMDETTPNSLTNTIDLLNLNLEYFDTLLEPYSKINFVDIGVGNAMPVRPLLEHFRKTGKLKRYIGLDISRELLGIAEQNLRNWFGDDFPVETYVRDINYERFDDLLVGESFGPESSTTANVALFLGGTLNNFRRPDHPLTTIHDSMGKRDLLLFTKKLDTERSRRYFDFTAPGNLEFDLVLRLLNVDSSYYTIEQFFDENKMARQIQVRFNVAISIEFELDGNKCRLDLNKGDSVLIGRARHQSAIETIKQFDENGFELLQASRSKDQDYLLTLSKVKINRQ
jgi:uncharacterized SAM-dependent methyltransferase